MSLFALNKYIKILNKKFHVDFIKFIRNRYNSFISIDNISIDKTNEVLMMTRT